MKIRTKVGFCFLTCFLILSIPLINTVQSIAVDNTIKSFINKNEILSHIISEFFDFSNFIPIIKIISVIWMVIFIFILVCMLDFLNYAPIPIDFYDVLQAILFSIELAAVITIQLILIPFKILLSIIISLTLITIGYIRELLFPRYQIGFSIEL